MVYYYCMYNGVCVCACLCNKSEANAVQTWNLLAIDEEESLELGKWWGRPKLCLAHPVSCRTTTAYAVPGAAVLW